MTKLKEGLRHYFGHCVRWISHGHKLNKLNLQTRLREQSMHSATSGFMAIFPNVIIIKKHNNSNVQIKFHILNDGKYSDQLTRVSIIWHIKNKRSNSIVTKLQVRLLSYLHRIIHMNKGKTKKIFRIQAFCRTKTVLQWNLVSTSKIVDLTWN